MEAAAQAAEHAEQPRGRQVRTSGLGLEAYWWSSLARGSLSSAPGETLAWERRRPQGNETKRNWEMALKGKISVLEKPPQRVSWGPWALT